jgi:imidazolonepropionase-like amidohydrolase
MRAGLCALLFATTVWAQPPSTPGPTRGAVIFEGARLLRPGSGPPIQRSMLLVENGRIVRIGETAGDVKAPAGATRIDLAGKTVMPLLVDTHVHLGYQKGLVFAADNFTRDTIVDQLDRYLYAGVGAVLSLGTDPGTLPFQVRADQAAGRRGGSTWLTAGRGIAAPNAGPGTPELKASAYGITTEEEARRAVREQTANKVDFIKIWVDDRNGTVPKLDPALSRSVIDEAHKHGTRVIAHVFYLDDAKDLARAGVDGFAHLVRDREADDELVALVKSRNIFVMPNLAISENGAHASPPDWLADPLLRETSPADVIARVGETFGRRTPEAVARAQRTYAAMQRTLARLNAAGVTIVLGTDDGAVRDHFYAYTAHRELRLMVEAGMSPAQVLTAATKTSADVLRLTDRGRLEPGSRADLLVLDANPLDDIAHTTRIAAVYRNGVAVDRAALREGFSRP